MKPTIGLLMISSSCSPCQLTWQVLSKQWASSPRKYRSLETPDYDDYYSRGLMASQFCCRCLYPIRSIQFAAAQRAREKEGKIECKLLFATYLCHALYESGNVAAARFIIDLLMTIWSLRLMLAALFMPGSKNNRSYLRRQKF
jgi:hypothetical protein